MALFKVCLPVHQLFLLQVRGHMCHLDICILRVQVFGINLQKMNVNIRDQCGVVSILRGKKINPHHKLNINSLTLPES